MKRLELHIHGRVQGVAFRWSTQRQAQALGLTGWVRNLVDGSVRVLAEGEADNLQRLWDWAQDGPDHARVEGVKATWSDAVGDQKSFEVTG